MRPSRYRAPSLRRGLAKHLAPLGFVMLGLSSPAHADDRDQRMAALFDKPALTRTVPAKSDAEEGNELRCTYYADFMIREVGTDTPDPGAASLIPVSAGARPACVKTPLPREMALPTASNSLVGRKGPFIVFQATDPNGSVPFIVLNAGTGKRIYSDGMMEDGLTAVSLEGGVLHLRFRRGINLACSLMADAAACWSKTVAAGTISPDLADLRPPEAMCAKTYRTEKAPADDPSIVSYDVVLTLSATGEAHVGAHGAVACSPMP